MLAVFWADADIVNGGEIYFRDSTDPIDLDHASMAIANSFGLPDFNASYVVIVTYYEVGIYSTDNVSYNNRNTFQAVMVEGDVCSYVIFNYPKITWVGPPPQAGFDAGDDVRYFSIPGSNTNSLIDIDETTNIERTGRWIFRTCGNFDSCSSGNGGCSQICTTHGNDVICSCREGYSLAFDNVTCDDINECNDNNGGCEDICINDDGSFHCAAHPVLCSELMVKIAKMRTNV
ncbi:sushi, nidogen and EGF-like domain-containing protein 1 [Ptychodera flava]|uniref:sushi, nidogen and EGF-like domain-containing protein 1 n=1 Tax=Ptychodera flava TaxID=63121 RepID=UPI00396A0E0D